MKLRNFLCLIVPFFLVACGGGGGGGGTGPVTYTGNSAAATISQANALKLVSSMIGGAGSAPVLTVAETAPSAPGGQPSTAGTNTQGILTELHRPFFSRLLPAGVAAGQQAAATGVKSVQGQATISTQDIPINLTEPCDNGNVNFSGTLSNSGLGTINFRFNNCALGSDVFNGTGSLRIDGYDLLRDEFTDATFTFDRVSLTGAIINADLSGTMRDQLDYPGNSEALTMNLIVEDRQTGHQVQTENFNIQLGYDSIYNPGAYTEAYNGRIYDSDEGYIDVMTFQPLDYSSQFLVYPDRGGHLKLTGNAGASIEVVWQSATVVMLVIDTDGDNAADFANSMPWTVFGGTTGTPQPPVVPAINDQAIGNIGLALDAGGSFDANGDLLTYSWQVVAEPAPGAGSFTSGNSPATSFSGNTDGSYSISLTVSDGSSQVVQNFTVSVYNGFSVTNPRKLNFAVVDAEYNASNDEIVMVSTGPDELHIYNPATGSESVVTLPLAPTSVSISLDGAQAAVGHDGYVSHIDLAQRQVLATLNLSTSAADVVLATNGFIHATSGLGQHQSLRSIDIAVNTETSVSNFSSYINSTMTLHPNGNDIYERDSLNEEINRYSIQSGAASYLYSSRHNYSIVKIGKPWITEDGSRLFMNNGAALTLSTVQAQDLQEIGFLAGISYILDISDSSELGKAAIIPDSPVTGGTGVEDTEIRIFDTQTLVHLGTVTLPTRTVGSTTHPHHGRHVFYSADGSLLHVITELDSGANAARPWHVATYATNPEILITGNQPGNAAPVAEAGDDQPLQTGTTGQLSGSASIDPDGGPLTYLWSLDAVPPGSTGATLTSPNLATSGFIPDVAGFYKLRLTVSDGQASHHDTLTVMAWDTYINLVDRVVDAEYSKSLDRIIIVTNFANLYRYDPSNGFSIPLAILPHLPTSVSVSPDGLFAVVGHDGFITHVDLSSLTVLATYPTSIDVGDIVHGGNGFAYATAGSGQAAAIYSYDLANGTEQVSTGSPLYVPARIKLHPTEAALYGSDGGINKYAIAGGSVTFVHELPQFSPFFNLGNGLWIAEDGSRLFTDARPTYRTSQNAADDLFYNGMLAMTNILIGQEVESLDHSTESGRVAALQAKENAIPPLIDPQREMHIFGDQYLVPEAKIILPDFPQSTAHSFGRFTFFNNDGTRLYVITAPSVTLADDNGVISFGGM